MQDDFFGMIKSIKEETRFGDKLVAERYKVKDEVDKYFHKDRVDITKKYRHRNL
jgi:hypothetical protein